MFFVKLTVFCCVATRLATPATRLATLATRLATQNHKTGLQKVAWAVCACVKHCFLMLFVSLDGVCCVATRLATLATRLATLATHLATPNHKTRHQKVAGLVCACAKQCFMAFSMSLA